MTQDDFEKLEKLYEHMAQICLHTVDTINSISESNKITYGNNKFIRYSNFKLELNNIKQLLVKHLDYLHPINNKHRLDIKETNE